MSSHGAPNPPLTVLGDTDPYGWGFLHGFLPGSLGAVLSLSHQPRVTRPHVTPQPFSKSATEHVQSRLSKKQVPPDLFQVGIAWVALPHLVPRGYPLQGAGGDGG